MTNDELEQYIYSRTRQFVGAHVLEVVNELLAASTASNKQEPVAYLSTDPAKWDRCRIKKQGDFTVPVFAAAPEAKASAEPVCDDPLWDRKGNVRHDAVDRLRDKQAAIEDFAPVPDARREP